MADVRGRAILERDDDVVLEVGIRLRSMLHEIRQPVATVLALAEAARGVTGASEELLEYLDRIEAQIQEIPSAASSVLEPPVGRVAEGTPPDVDEVVGSVVRDFALTWAGTLRRR